MEDDTRLETGGCCRCYDPMVVDKRIEDWYAIVWLTRVRVEVKIIQAGVGELGEVRALEPVHKAHGGT